jgi:hypothetical protein
MSAPAIHQIISEDFKTPLQFFIKTEEGIAPMQFIESEVMAPL